jgi:hypothetical protein
MGKDKKGKHKTVDKELKPSMSWLESLPQVEKVVLGFCESARHAYKPGTLRHKSDTLGGIKINAYGGRGIIDIYVKVKTAEKDELLLKIKERWPN